MNQHSFIMRSSLFVFLLLLVFSQSAFSSDASTFLAVKLPNPDGSIEDFTNNWKLTCELDAMEDARSCTIIFQVTMTKTGGFMTFVAEGGSVLISVVGNKYPGSTQIIRIDSNEPLRTDADSLFLGDKNLIAQLKSGKTLKARWYDWPNNSKNDTEQTLTGFSRVLDLALKVVDGEEFSLPRETLENFYSWEGYSLAVARDSIRQAMQDDYFSKACNLQFDPDERIREILGAIPGAAGLVMKRRYTEEYSKFTSKEVWEYTPGTLLNCGENVEALSRGIKPIPNLIYPDI